MKVNARWGYHIMQIDKSLITEAWSKSNINIANKDELKNLLKQGVDIIAQEAHRQHGFRIQNMFAYVAFALGNCSLVKQEDAGDIYVDDMNIKIPDFRIITCTGETFFVEVKNCADKKITFKKGYIDKLLLYSEMNKMELKIAIYWRVVKKWVLLPAKLFNFSNSKTCTINLSDSFFLNEMSQKLKDQILGTVLPLRLRIITDKNKNHTIEKDGKTNFTIANVEIYCGNNLLTNDWEQKIAYQLILSNRLEEQNEAKILENKLLYIDLVYDSLQESEQGFKMIASLSSIISAKYDLSTVKDGEVARFRPQREPIEFQLSIPEGYKSKTLPLWIFSLRPNTEHKTIGKSEIS